MFSLSWKNGKKRRGQRQSDLVFVDEKKILSGINMVAIKKSRELFSFGN